MLNIKNHPVDPILTILVIMALVLTASLSFAGEETQNDTHRGLFIGINAGFGSHSVGYKEGSRSIFEDPTEGGMGSLRIGYAFSQKFALSLEGTGFGSDDDNDEDLGIGIGVLAVTWHPCGKGFFLRAGIGGGGGNIKHPVTGEVVTIKDKGGALFSLGYDWYLGDSTSLGLSFDHMAIDAGGATGFDDDYIGASGMSLQFNWYL